MNDVGRFEVQQIQRFEIDVLSGDMNRDAVSVAKGGNFSSHKMHIGVDVVSICNRFVYPMMIRVIVIALMEEVVEDQKNFEAQHGEKYIQLKNYTDQIEAELGEIRSKMESLTSSNEELREAYREKARKCRNWEKMCKALKAQHTTRGAPSPSSSSASMGHTIRPESNAYGTLPAQFARSISRPLSYTSEKSPGMLLRPQVAPLRRPETPNIVRQRPNRPILERVPRTNSGCLSTTSLSPDFKTTRSSSKDTDTIDPTKCFCPKAARFQVQSSECKTPKVHENQVGRKDEKEFD
ncbi:hypothetical protein ABG067_000814 [Albugo candida]